MENKKCANCRWWKKKNNEAYSFYTGYCTAPIPMSIVIKDIKMMDRETDARDCKSYERKLA